MKELNNFLTALSNRLNNCIGYYIPRKKVVPCKFPAIKEFTLEVWRKQGDHVTIISSVVLKERATTKEEIEAVEEKMYIKTIENLLERYGI